MIKNPEVVKRIRRSDCLNYEKFDKTYNLDTGHPLLPTSDGSGQMRPGNIKNSIDLPESNYYEVTALEYLDMINAELIKDKDIDKYTFIDVGSGKGRVLFYNLIKNSPYKEYYGIEADPLFYQIAEKNKTTFNLPITKPLTFINANAKDYIVENKDCVYNFYAPFSKIIFDKFMLNNWDIIKNTKSYFSFLSEDDYEMRRYLDKPPIYDYAELTIYKLHD